MTFVGYYEFSYRGSDRIGLFSTSLLEEVYSVEFFQLLNQEESIVRLGNITFNICRLSYLISARHFMYPLRNV